MTLSDKRYDMTDQGNYVFIEADVKEFIKDYLTYAEYTNVYFEPLHIKKFKELAGEDLV